MLSGALLEATASSKLLVSDAEASGTANRDAAAVVVVAVVVVVVVVVEVVAVVFEVVARARGARERDDVPVLRLSMSFEVEACTADGSEAAEPGGMSSCASTEAADACSGLSNDAVAAVRADSVSATRGNSDSL